MSNELNFKSCQYLDKVSGICKMAQASPEASTQLINGSVSIQCRFLQPVPTFECPNPKINPPKSEEEDIFDTIKEEPEDLDSKIYDLRNISTDGSLIDAIVTILSDFKYELAVLKEEIRRNTDETLKSLETRVKTVEKILHSEKKAGILFPNGEATRPQPTRKKSKESEKELDITNPDQADKNLEESMSTLDISEDLFKDHFFAQEEIEGFDLEAAFTEDGEEQDDEQY